MVSSDNVAGPEPVDPVYARLFRDDEPAPVVAVEDVPAPISPRETHSDDVYEPDAEGVDEPPAQEAASEPDFAIAGQVDILDEDDADVSAPPVTPPTADSSVDTGRLFRSQGVKGGPEAVLALSSDHGGRLRTLTRTEVESTPAEPIGGPGAAVDAEGGAGIAASGASVARASRRRPAREPRGASHRSGSLRAGAVYLLVIGVTLLVAFANALLANGDIGWPTGVALVAVTAYCAWNVRREDDSVAIITPPIAFFLAALTAGQFFLGASAGGLLNRAVVAFFTLADNWYWIIGATLVAVVLVVVRRRRA